MKKTFLINEAPLQFAIYCSLSLIRLLKQSEACQSKGKSIQLFMNLQEPISINFGLSCTTQPKNQGRPTACGFKGELRLHEVGLLLLSCSTKG